jgi:hypothetical protein
MNTETIDKLIWTLIYGGLIAMAIGMATERNSVAAGWVLMTGGGIVSVVGAVLIYVRSRMKEPQ